MEPPWIWLGTPLAVTLSPGGALPTNTWGVTAVLTDGGSDIVKRSQSSRSCVYWDGGMTPGDVRPRSGSDSGKLLGTARLVWSDAYSGACTVPLISCQPT